MGVRCLSCHTCFLRQAFRSARVSSTLFALACCFSSALPNQLTNVFMQFRAYTDPLNANSNALNPPSIPPPPPPPPPLNVPPSRARLQLAARLAMNKRNAAAAAASNGEQEGSSPPAAEDAPSSGVFSPPTTTSSGERMRNPFADYDDDDEDNSGSGSDDGEVETVEGGSSLGMDSSAWDRGSWWRGVVRGTRRGGSGSGVGRDSGDNTRDAEMERFGDGRDDDSSDDETGRRMAEVDDVEDEEFGDFAMPEVEDRVTVSGIDPARESILVKPMALHPTTTTLKSSTISPFSSLWPFSREKREGDLLASSQGQGQGEGSNASTPTGPTGPGAMGPEGITEEPVELTREEEAMISEDGKKINRAVEATRRTSIEDPDDDDEVDVGEEIVVRRGGAGAGAAGVR